MVQNGAIQGDCVFPFWIMYYIQITDKLLQNLGQY